jgi:hypothetical protein
MGSLVTGFLLAGGIAGSGFGRQTITVSPVVALISMVLILALFGLAFRYQVILVVAVKRAKLLESRTSLRITGKISEVVSGANIGHTILALYVILELSAMLMGGASYHLGIYLRVSYLGLDIRSSVPCANVRLLV